MNRAEAENFADAVRWRREELGLSQGGFAKIMKVRQQTVSHWERGEATPRPKRVNEVAQALQLDARNLQVLAGHMSESDNVGDRVEQVGRVSAKFHLLDERDQATIERLIDSMRDGNNPGGE